MALSKIYFFPFFQDLVSKRVGSLVQPIIITRASSVIHLLRHLARCFLILLGLLVLSLFFAFFCPRFFFYFLGHTFSHSSM